MTIILFFRVVSGGGGWFFLGVAFLDLCHFFDFLFVATVNVLIELFAFAVTAIREIPVLLSSDLIREIRSCFVKIHRVTDVVTETSLVDDHGFAVLCALFL